MINLNLLPRETKRELNKNIQSIELANNIILLTITVFLVVVLLVVANNYLGYKMSKINVAVEAGSEEKEINALNSQMSQLEVIQRDYVKWSRVLKNLFKLIPEGNTLEKVFLDKDSGQIEITGFSEQRQNFLALKESLEKSDLFSEIQSPITNILKRDAINFSLKAKFKF
jgi:Tfp pilus assembly protein PilN